MKKTNTLPALWYIKNNEEVRKYIAQEYPDASKWVTWKYIGIDGNRIHNGGGNASHSPLSGVELTIEQFRAHIKSDVVINDYEIY